MCNRVTSGLFLCLILSATVLAQSNYGVITGTVTDPQHLAVSGAEIQLTAKSTSAIRRVASNEQGLFEAPALLPDEYEVQAKASAFAENTQTVRLEVGAARSAGNSTERWRGQAGRQRE